MAGSDVGVFGGSGRVWARPIPSLGESGRVRTSLGESGCVWASLGTTGKCGRDSGEFGQVWSSGLVWISLVEWGVHGMLAKLSQVLSGLA